MDDAKVELTVFRRRFVAAAAKRLRGIAEAIAMGHPAEVCASFHQLAGDAFLLNLQALGEQAAAGEVSAIQWQQGDSAGRQGCSRALENMRRLIGEESEAPRSDG